MGVRPCVIAEEFSSSDAHGHDSRAASANHPVGRQADQQNWSFTRKPIRALIYRYDDDHGVIDFVENEDPMLDSVRVIFQAVISSFCCFLRGFENMLILFVCWNWGAAQGPQAQQGQTLNPPISIESTLNLDLLRRN
jgi:hypothetical protein